MSYVHKNSVCLTGVTLKKRKKEKMTSWSFIIPSAYVYIASNNRSPYCVDVGFAFSDLPIHVMPVHHFPQYASCLTIIPELI